MAGPRNTFGSIPHSKISQLFESLPIPERIKVILNGIYIATTNQFAPMKIWMYHRNHVLGKWIRCYGLSPIISNLASEPIIRQVKEFEGIYQLGNKVQIRYKLLRWQCTDNSATPFWYANREVGDLAIGHLNQEVNIWTITKAVQLLSLHDIQITTISSRQLKETRKYSRS